MATKKPMKKTPAKKVAVKSIAVKAVTKKVKPARGTHRVNGLLPRQSAFLAEYLLTGNATQSAIKAGYSADSAHVTAHEILRNPKVAGILAQKQSEIAARQDESLAKMELTEERVMRETARLAFFDPRKMFAPDGRPLNITELDDDTAAAIGGLEVLESYEGTGEDRRLVGVIKKYKVADKNSALDKAAKILGMFKKDNEQPGAATANAITALIQSMGKSSLPVVSEPGAKDRK